MEEVKISDVKLRLPPQAAPVMRTTVATAFSGKAEINPSVDWNAVLDVAGPFLTGLASLMGSGG